MQTKHTHDMYVFYTHTHPHAYIYIQIYIRQRIWILALTVKSTSGTALLGRIFLWGDWSLFFTLLLQGKWEGLPSQPSWEFWCGAFMYLNTCTCKHPPYSLSCLSAVPVPPGRCYKLHREVFKIKKKYRFENHVFLMKWLWSMRLDLFSFAVAFFVVAGHFIQCAVF